MKDREWLKPGIYGAAIGAVALATVGFSWGGWMTTGKAAEMAANHARLEVVAALVPICLEQSKQDPLVIDTLAQLKRAEFYNRADMLIAAGSATMPGSNDPIRMVATECSNELAARF